MGGSLGICQTASSRLSCIPLKQTVPDGTSKVGGSRRRETTLEQSSIAKPAQLGAGVYEGGLRYELHVGKCNALCRVMPKSREGEGSPRPSQPLGKDSVSTPTPSLGPVEGRHQEDRSHHVRTWPGLACGIFWLGLPWCSLTQKPSGCCLVPH